MEKQREDLRFPKGDYSDEVKELLDKFASACEQFVSAEDKKELRDSLHSMYWRITVEVIPDLITEENKEDFHIPESFRDWLCFGYVNELLSPNPELNYPSETIEIPPSLQSVMHEYKVIYLDDWLIRAYNRLIKLKDKRRADRKLQHAEKELEEYPQKLEECYKRQKEFLEEYPISQEALITSKEIEQRLYYYDLIREKIETSQRIAAYERQKYVQLNQELSELREYRTKQQRAIGDKIPINEMMRLNKETEETILLRRTLEKDLDKAKDDVSRDIIWRDSIPVVTLREEMKSELRRLRALVDLMARRSRAKAISVLTDTAILPSPIEIIQAIEDILLVDPRLFSRLASQRVTMPGVLIIPGFGNGMYDWEMKSLIIPTRSPKDVLESVATALIEYRLDADEDNILRDSYLRLEKNKGIYSTIQLRERMVGEYLVWITREAKGYQTLDKESRQWFLDHIAPEKFALKYPRYMGLFTANEGFQLLAELEQTIEKNADNFEDQFQLGIVCWRLGMLKKANHAFIKASELQPESQDACYNAALSCFKIDQRQKAKDYWRKYLMLDTASFWTTRVQEFVSQMRR